MHSANAKVVTFGAALDGLIHRPFGMLVEAGHLVLYSVSHCT
jgi:hypothetical protein